MLRGEPRDTIHASFELALLVEGGGRAHGPRDRGCCALGGDDAGLTGLLGILRGPAAPSRRRRPHRSGRRQPAYSPLPNVSAVSCAPSSSAAASTCVAVGDDGGNFASIIVTSNGGSTWSDSTPPSGVTTLSTVSCPSAASVTRAGAIGDHEVERRWGEMVRAGCDLPGAVDLVLHDRRVHRGGGSQNLRDRRWRPPGSLKPLRPTRRSLIERVLSKRHHLHRSWRWLTADRP